jgi:hypothetical protein
MMKIRFVQSGGFVGLIRECEINTQDLPPAEAQHVRDLVLKSGIPPEGEFVLRKPEARDVQVYSITLEGDGYRVRAVYDQLSVPPEARPLVAYLMSQAKPFRRGR